MRKLTNNHLQLIQGGKINWNEFAQGFCDGFTIATAITGNVVGAAVIATSCDFFGIGSNIISNLK